MASVTFDEVFIHDASDPDTSISALLTNLDETATKPGAVRLYAGGNARSSSRTGVLTSFDVGLEFADRDDAEQLKTWSDDHARLVFRDPLGRVIWGVVFQVYIRELAGTDGTFANVTFTFQQVTADAEV